MDDIEIVCATSLPLPLVILDIIVDEDVEKLAEPKSDPLVGAGGMEPEPPRLVSVNI
jgi:hypothetical protein